LLSGTRNKIVIASANVGKLREIGKLLAGLDREFISQSELGISSVAESGETFVDNALIKARHAAAQSGLPAIADDSGLLVDTLGGRPGIHSARYADEDASDEDNVDKLLSALDGLPQQQRGAHYECAAVWVSPDDVVEPLVAEGQWHGRILCSRRGVGGFGYDPVFLDIQMNKTGAELSLDEKNRLSHRGKAFLKLRDLLMT
jgi:XTP/dITP diphosphohydrolase